MTFWNIKLRYLLQDMEQDTFDVRNLAFPVFVFAERAHKY